MQVRIQDFGEGDFVFYSPFSLHHMDGLMHAFLNVQNEREVYLFMPL